jgi:predicted GIY-YIG superfamily endonuclease
VPYFVYILRCADRSLYIGHTDDLDARLEKHNRGDGAAFTAQRVPVVVAYVETFDNRVEAAARERQLKRWTRAKKEALIARDLALLKRL